MDERELNEQPQEEPRQPEPEQTEEPQASQQDAPRDEPAAMEQADQAAGSEARDETVNPASDQEPAPVEQVEQPEASALESEPEPTHEERDDMVGDAPPSELPSLMAAEAAEETQEPETVPAEEEESYEALRRTERRREQMIQGEVPPEASTEPAWYVIHCYSGYENKVRHNLEQRIETMGMKDKIFDVVIPTQEEIEVREGKRRTVERHIFPGYVLVNMILTEESWYVVRNTPGVTGFVGMGNLPTALRPEEVSQIIKRMEAEAPTVKVSFKEGERVRIIDGPFNDFRGTVSEIDMERTKVRVMVSFFGRETPVELDFLQVEKA
jgi:transcriptional antiterminator NusG